MKQLRGCGVLIVLAVMETFYVPVSICHLCRACHGWKIFMRVKNFCVKNPTLLNMLNYDFISKLLYLFRSFVIAFSSISVFVFAILLNLSNRNIPADGLLHSANPANERKQPICEILYDNWSERRVAKWCSNSTLEWKTYNQRSCSSTGRLWIWRKRQNVQFVTKHHFQNLLTHSHNTTASTS